MSLQTSRRVLVAEDQPLLLWAIGRALRPLGVEVVLAPSFQETCDLLASGEFAAAVVASPLEERSVIELLREVDRSRPRTRLIVLCGDGGGERLQTEIPRAIVFQKPFPLSELTAVIPPVPGHHAHA